MALTVMSVGIVAVMGVLQTSLKVAGEGGNRSRAIAFATKEAESLRALRYDQLGFGPAQEGFGAQFEGRTTVVVAAPNLVRPSGPDEVIGGQRYSFERHIVWADAASATAAGTTYTQAYKRIAVIVSWADLGGAHAARQDAVIYPGGQGAYQGPMGATTTTTLLTGGGTTPSAPTLLVALAGNPPANAVNLTWVAPLSSNPSITSWVIEYSADGWATATRLTDTQPPTTTTFSVNGLSASTGYQFRVAGRASSGTLSSWSAPVSISTAALPLARCEVGMVSITPNAIERKSSSTTVLGSNATVSANTTGPCVGLHVSYVASGVTVSNVYLSAGSGGVWTGAIDGTNTSWDTGVHTMNLLDQGNAALSTFTLTVCLKVGHCP